MKVNIEIETADLINMLALAFADRRTHGEVFMDGKHNPLPGEIQAARHLVQDICAVGGRRDLSLSDLEIPG
jgi:hypothetical protein